MHHRNVSGRGWPIWANTAHRPRSRTRSSGSRASRTPSAAGTARVGEIPNDKHHVNEGEIVESHPTDRFVLHAHDKEGDYANTFTLKPVGSSTEVTIHLEFMKMHGMAAMMVPIIFPLVGKKDMRDRMAKLKQTVEAAPSG